MSFAENEWHTYICLINTEKTMIDSFSRTLVYVEMENNNMR